MSAEAGAERVIISAPAPDPDLTVVLGVNGDEYLSRCDVWPLNPKGELLLGVKLEGSVG